MKNSEGIFNYLKGNWTIHRVLSNKNEPCLNGSASGRVSILEEKKNTLAYKENLELQLNKSKLQVHKEYDYVLDQGKIQLYDNFNGEISFMFNIELQNTQLATGQYRCNQDSYNATYYFCDNDKFTLRFDVTGPEKNYSIKSVFTRETDVDITGQTEFDN